MKLAKSDRGRKELPKRRCYLRGGDTRAAKIVRGRGVCTDPAPYFLFLVDSNFDQC